MRGVSTAEKSQTAPSGRQQFSFPIPSYSGLRLGRIYRNKSSANLLLTIADLFSNFKRRKYLTLDEILSTVQNVWQEPKTSSFPVRYIDMENSVNKSFVQETHPPVPLRRRLSVPETIMRKHNLAVERSSIQEFKHYHWDKEVECSSDPNLNRKKDSNFMRKSTLLRRLWGDGNSPKLCGSFQEWQHSYKLSSTQSLNSSHSSPEHISRKFESSSPRKFSSHRLSSKSLYEEQTPLSPPIRKMSVRQNSSLNTLSKTPLSRESTTQYTCSSFTNVSDTNSDSAYTNSISNFTSSVSSRQNTTRTKPDEDSNRPRRSMQETAVQTRDITNLNVISNINLSQSTLDVIFKEVMKDVGKLPPGDFNFTTATVISDETSGVKVEKVPSFILDANSEISLEPTSSTDKFIISKVRVGSPYSKPTETRQPDVPRFSAVPRSSSMEVNTSEEDKEESDSVSFVDSLEDFSSPRDISNSRRSSTDVAQLLPEGKKDRDKDDSLKKSSTFFIPIQTSNEKSAKTVSELLPLKVRERIKERQQKREEKTKQYRSLIQPTTSNISVIKSTLNFANNLPKKRTKPVLPSIASLKKSSYKDKQNDPSIRRKNREVPKPKEHKSFRYLQDRENAKPVQSELENNPKDIEILEEMECIEISQGRIKKSRIPVATNTNKKTELGKPTYLDLDNHTPDPKVDQLIANILIDSLNHDMEAAKSQDLQNANFQEEVARAHNENKYEQIFDVIPEENQRHSLTRSTVPKDSNENCTKTETSINSMQNLSSIPKGWVTVYTVHKDVESPESTSDEGKKCLMDSKEVRDEVASTVREKSASLGIPNCGNHIDHFIPSSRHGNPTFGSTLYHNSLNKFNSHHRKFSGREQEHGKKTLGDWSVTISGSNSCGQMVPDVEMRLKFPKQHRTNSNSSTQKENNRNNKCSFPVIDHDKKIQDYGRKYSKEKLINDESLPKIQTAGRKIMRREGSVTSMTPSVMIPRQTKTSTSRYHFSRPRERYSLPDVPSILKERQYFEIMQHIPDILAVTGRSISPERRSFEER